MYEPDLDKIEQQRLAKEILAIQARIHRGNARILDLEKQAERYKAYVQQLHLELSALLERQQPETLEEKYA
jgi:hypothetical protein